MDIVEFENNIYEIISHNEYTIGINEFYQIVTKNTSMLSMFFRVINRIKEKFENDSERKYIIAMLMLLECVSREKNLIAKNNSYKEYEKKYLKIEKIINDNFMDLSRKLKILKDTFDYEHLNILSLCLKKTLILNKDKLTNLERVQIKESILICSKQCKDLRLIDKNTYNEKEKDVVDIKLEIEKDSLVIIDYDNIKVKKLDVEKISSYTTVIIICHRLSQKILIEKLNIKGMIKVINVNSEAKQASDFKIYSILTKGQLLNIKNIYLVSKDKGFDLYCGINNINYKRIETLGGACLKQSYINNFMNIDEITIDSEK